jgi:protein-L-isoaspartate(D-aspartate) O-methyltransferase
MNGKERKREYELKGRDIANERVLKAMEQVDREIFVPESLKYRAYEDTAPPIDRNQTISQPYIVAYMAQIIDPQP